MFWIKRIRDLAAVFGLATAVGVLHLAWLNRPLPELELDWQNLAAAMIEVEQCDLAFDILLDAASDAANDGAEAALDAAEALVTDGVCPMGDREYAAQRIEWSRESFELATESDNSYSNPYLESSLTNWLSQLSVSLYDYDEAVDKGVHYPALFWIEYAARQMRCEIVPYDQLTIWWRLKEVNEALKDQDLAPRQWIAWEEECAARSLRLGQRLGGTLLAEDDPVLQEHIGLFISGLLFDTSDGTEEVQAAAEYERAVLELELGAQLGANACQISLPNALPNTVGSAASALADNYFLHDHVGSAERLGELFEDGRFVEADEDAAAFWWFAAARTAGDDEALAAFGDDQQTTFSQILDTAGSTTYAAIYGYLPDYPQLEDWQCFEWYVVPVTRAADKPKLTESGDGEESVVDVEGGE